MKLDDGQRARLAALADALIPAADGMPSASEAGVASGGVDHVLSVRPDLAAPLRIALAESGSAEQVLDTLEPDVVAALGEIVAGAYFLVAEVRERVGYQGRDAIPVTELTDADRALTEPVVHRGPIYRDDPR